MMPPTTTLLLQETLGIVTSGKRTDVIPLPWQQAQRPTRFGTGVIHWPLALVSAEVKYLYMVMGETAGDTSN